MTYLELLSLILSVAAVAIGAVALALLARVQKLRKEFFTGRQASNLEEFIINQNKKINELAKRMDYIEDAVKNLDNKQRLSVQKMGLIRYNPFNDDGGNLSFSLAILDEHQNGVVITSLHGREQNRIYAKPIQNGNSDYTLTSEEQKAVIESRNL